MLGIFSIKAKMLAGNQFTDAEFDQTVETGVPSSIYKFNDLTDGGRFNFGPRFADMEACTLKRVVLNLGDATDWTLSLRTTDANGTSADVVLYERSDFGSNSVTINEDVIAHIFPSAGELLVLTTTAASTDMTAEVTFQGWAS